ncbi:MAG: S49 family peptidase, partial [Phaeospirillum sp.]|nr:S49 family peptidase [Phaeospirillum sp.]
FTTLVAERRRLSPDAVRVTEAAVYRGDQAVAAGLADKVGTLRVALADLGAVLARPSIRSPVLSKPKETTMSKQTGDIPVIETERPTPGAIVPMPSKVTAQVEQRLRAEYSEISAIAAQAARLGVTIDPAEAMATGIRPEAQRRTVLEQLAERSEATDVVAAAPAGAVTKTETESPIVRRAREAAARK